MHVELTRCHRFDAQLRGERVVCEVAPATDRGQRITVECLADNIESGMRVIAKFAGFCDRILVLEEPSSDDLAWAQVLASYFGFGLAVRQSERIDLVMPPAEGSTDYSTGARSRFLRSVLDHLV